MDYLVVLVIDDQIFGPATKVESVLAEYRKPPKEQERLPDIPLPGMIQALVQEAERGQRLELYAAKYANCVLKDSSGQDLASDVIALTRNTPEWTEKMLERVDVLFLDLHGVASRAAWPERWNLSADVLKKDQNIWYADETRKSPPKSDKEWEDDCKTINENYPGISFLMQEPALAQCQLVCITTAAPSKWPVNCLHNATRQRERRLLMKKHWNHMSGMIDTIQTLAARFNAGSSYFTNIYDVEVAAQDLEPVLVVGETGTGKEAVAKSIHQRLLYRLQRDRKFFIPEVLTVNAAQFSPELAAGELFGWVVNTHSTASQHNVGLLLGQLGVRLDQPTPPRNGAGQARTASLTDQDHFREQLVAWRSDRSLLRFTRTGEWDLQLEIDQEGYIPNKKPLFTLILDEFGDLAPNVQVLLLRTFENGELRPIGYPGVIRGVYFRTIATTSDLRVARFLGHGDFVGAWRSRSELTRPFRQDLLERLGHHRIRVEPVNINNVEQRIFHLTRSQTWEGPEGRSARKLLIDCAKDQLKATQAAQVEWWTANGLVEVPVFGHMRMLQKVVQRVEDLVRSASTRGVHGFGVVEAVEEVTGRSGGKVPWHSPFGSLFIEGAGARRGPTEFEPIEFRVPAVGKVSWKEWVGKHGASEMAFLRAIIRTRGINFGCKWPADSLALRHNVDRYDELLAFRREYPSLWANDKGWDIAQRNAAISELARITGKEDISGYLQELKIIP